MSDNPDDGVYARDARSQPILAWVGLAALLLGAGLLTVAVVYLASDQRVSLIVGAVGLVVTIVGLTLMVTRGNLSGRG